ncbi:MAG: hypothetical protein AAF320_05985 [Myxococcota bacterium]
MKQRLKINGLPQTAIFLLMLSCGEQNNEQTVADLSAKKTVNDCTQIKDQTQCPQYTQTDERCVWDRNCKPLSKAWWNN